MLSFLLYILKYCPCLSISLCIHHRSMHPHSSRSLSLQALPTSLCNLRLSAPHVSSMAIRWGRPKCVHFLCPRERVDQVGREKEKLRSDLEKAEKLKSLMASEVDDHHAAIERRNEYNLR